MKVKLSLIAFQKVLAGELSYEVFARDHSELVKAIKSQTAAGKMIGQATIEYLPGEDDDWIEFVFDKRLPARLFDTED